MILEDILGNYGKLCTITHKLLKNISSKKNNCSFLWIGFTFHLNRGCRANLRRQVILTTKSPEIPGTHLIERPRMKG